MELTELLRAQRNRKENTVETGTTTETSVKMPNLTDKNETEEEDMDTADSDKSDEEESISDEGSEDESSELDEEEGDRKRAEYLEEMAELEKRFLEVKAELFKERKQQVEKKYDEVKSGRAVEYLNPLAQLQENMRIRTQVAGVLKELRQQNIQNILDSELQSHRQNRESEKILAYDLIQQDIQDKIKRLEEDRQSIDITSDLLNESQNTRRRKQNSWSSTPEKRRKAVTVNGPYIVYMLEDKDVISDWSTIRKALKQSEKADKRRKEVSKSEKHPFSARYEDNKLFYEGEWYGKGQHIIIDNKEESPVHVTITAVNTGEVWVKRSDGTKSKLYIAMLQKGKYTIRHIPY